MEDWLQLKLVYILPYQLSFSHLSSSLLILLNLLSVWSSELYIFIKVPNRST